MAHQDGALGVRIGGPEDPNRLEHGDGAGGIVGGATRAIPAVQVGGEHHVLVRLLAAADLGDGVEHRLLTQELGVGGDPEPGALVPLGEPVHQAVVLAAQFHRGNGGGPGLEDLVDSPPVAPLRRDHPDSAGLFQRPRERRRVEAGLLDPALPGLRVGGALGAHRLERGGQRKLLDAGQRAAAGQGAGDQHDLAAHRRQPGPKRCRVGEVGNEDGLGGHRLAARGARAPGQHLALERADPGGHQVDVRGAPAPVHPGAVLLVAGGDAHLAVHRHQPVVGRLDAGRPGEPRSDRIGQRLHERHRLGTIHSLGPHRSDDGISRGECIPATTTRLGGKGGGGEGEKGKQGVSSHGGVGGWGLGTGDWGLGTRDWGLGTGVQSGRIPWVGGLGEHPAVVASSSYPLARPAVIPGEARDLAGKTSKLARLADVDQASPRSLIAPLLGMTILASPRALCPWSQAPSP